MEYLGSVGVESASSEGKVSIIGNSYKALTLLLLSRTSGAGVEVGNILLTNIDEPTYMSTFTDILTMVLTMIKVLMKSLS